MTQLSDKEQVFVNFMFLDVLGIPKKPEKNEKKQK